MYVCTHVCMSMSVWQYVSMSVFQYVSLSVCMYVVCLYVCMSASLQVGMSACLYVGMSVCMSVSMSVCLSMCMSVVCMSVCLSVCIYVYVRMSVGMHVCTHTCIATGIQAFSLAPEGDWQTCKLDLQKRCQMQHIGIQTQTLFRLNSFHQGSKQTTKNNGKVGMSRCRRRSCEVGNKRRQGKGTKG